MASTAAPPFQPPPLASDDDRERAAALLREHWVAGRLTLEQFEQRLAVVMAAADQAQLAGALAGLIAPVPPQPAYITQARASSGTAVAAIVFSICGLTVLVTTFALLSVVSVPLSITGWALGRSARRQQVASGVPPSGVARAAELIGIVGTVLGALALAGCAAVIAAS